MFSVPDSILYCYIGSAKLLNLEEASYTFLIQYVGQERTATGLLAIQTVALDVSHRRSR